MKRRVAMLVLSVVALAGLSVAPARAADVHVVDDDTDTGDCRFGDADHDTIQAAVTAAVAGDTIRVCPGEYVETVVVDKQLTIEGAKAGVDARTRSQDGESVVTFGDPTNKDPASRPNVDPDDVLKGLVHLLADGIRWDGFLIADNIMGPGMFTSQAHSGYEIRNTVFNDNGLGVHLNSNGVDKTTLRRNLFHANNEFEKAGAGTGIYSDLGARCILIKDNRFDRHNEAGILFADSGNLQSCVWVEKNKSVDDRSFAAFYNTSNLKVTQNTVSFAPRRDLKKPFGSAIFIGARNNRVVVAFNTIKSAGGNGIDVRDTPRRGLDPSPPRKVDIRRNKVRHAGAHGIDIDVTSTTGLNGPLPTLQTAQYLVRGNLSSRNRGVGIHVGPDTAGTFLHFNTALANGPWDCQDESTGTGTAGTNSIWKRNVGPDDDPDGICDPTHREHKKSRPNKPKKKKHPKRCLPMGVRPV
jgi:parallel beta helix pectate lyase-like protein